MRLKNQIRTRELAALILLLMILTGCSLKKKKVTLFVLDQTDIYETENGYICMSEFYVNKVLEVKIENRR